MSLMHQDERSTTSTLTAFGFQFCKSQIFEKNIAALADQWLNVIFASDVLAYLVYITDGQGVGRYYHARYIVVLVTSKLQMTKPDRNSTSITPEQLCVYLIERMADDIDSSIAQLVNLDYLTTDNGTQTCFVTGAKASMVSNGSGPSPRPWKPIRFQGDGNCYVPMALIKCVSSVFPPCLERSGHNHELVWLRAMPNTIKYVKANEVSDDRLATKLPRIQKHGAGFCFGKLSHKSDLIWMRPPLPLTPPRNHVYLPIVFCTITALRINRRFFVLICKKSMVGARGPFRHSLGKFLGTRSLAGQIIGKLQRIAS